MSREPAPLDFSTLLERFEERVCPGCGAKIMRLKGSSPCRCSECERRAGIAARVAAEAETVMHNAAAWLPEALKSAGMTTRELGASMRLIPRAVVDVLARPASGLDALRSGDLPKHGLGLSGPAGTGKTFALAALFRMNVERRWAKRAPTDGMAAVNPFLAWCRWPEVTNELRVLSMSDAGRERVQLLIARLSEAEAVVIDDLGAERISSTYDSDWATSQLDLVVDRRYNNLRPTWYTTNLSKPEFIDRYGARLFSRLCAENPMHAIKPGPDLRLTPGGKGPQP